jgi:formate dehydrogenase beta subunit
MERCTMPPKFSREVKNTISFDRQAPQYQPMTSPCEANCPAGHAIQRTIYLIQNNRFEEALENVRAKNPFPGVCGRACSHPCELPCNRQFYDEGILVRSLERAAFDHAEREKVKRINGREKTGKKIAIIGSGPAGMTCAYFSVLFGHDVTVFEALPILGGMPRIGVPDYRLPKEVVDREVGDIVDLGIRAKTSMRVGKDVSFQALREQYNACLIATGAWKEKTLAIPGSELATSGFLFMRRVKSGEKFELGERVVIVGGGGVAFDYAGTALRLGVKEVHIACLEPRDKMVTPEEDVVQGEAEGVILHNAKTFTRIVSDDGRVTGIECMDVRSFAFDEAGKLHVDAIPGSEKILPADTLIFAIGEEPDFGFLEDVDGFTFTKQATLEVNELSLATPLEGVYAAGDAITGPSSIAEAIGTGRRAAIAMDCYLNGKQMSEISSIYVDDHGYITTEEYAHGEVEVNSQHVVAYNEILNLEYYGKENQVKMRRLATQETLEGFDEINKGYTREEAIREANRCFHCGHCSMCGNCVELCPLDVLAISSWGPEVAYPNECWHCGSCRINCPCGAVYYEFPLSMLI